MCKQHIGNELTGSSVYVLLKSPAPQGPSAPPLLVEEAASTALCGGRDISSIVAVGGRRPGAYYYIWVELGGWVELS